MMRLVTNMGVIVPFDENLRFFGTEERKFEMNTIHIPGFTAEASFYGPGGRDQSATAQSYSSGEQGVIAQLSVGSGGLGGGGGLNAWGCWQSECCTTDYHYVCNPFCHWACNAKPCTRCIWPY